MGQRNSNDWSVFGLSGDPVPGDASLVTELGHMFTSRETAAYEVRVGVNALCTDPGVHDWLGRSGDAFRNTLFPLPRLLGQMVDAYSEAAAALDKYVTALGQAQSVADSAYQRRMAAVNDWSAKNGGQRPPLKTGGSNLDGWQVQLVRPVRASRNRAYSTSKSFPRACPDKLMSSALRQSSSVKVADTGTVNFPSATSFANSGKCPKRSSFVNVARSS